MNDLFRGGEQWSELNYGWRVLPNFVPLFVDSYHLCLRRTRILYSLLDLHARQPSYQMCERRPAVVRRSAAKHTMPRHPRPLDKESEHYLDPAS